MTNLSFFVEKAKDGNFTAFEKEKGRPLHSKYSPIQEAKNLVSSFKKDKESGALFLSMGLGYAPLEFHRIFPNYALAIAEPDLNFFLSALAVTDLDELFDHKELIMLLNADEKDCIPPLEKIGTASLKIFSTPAQIFHNENYFKNLTEEIEKSAQKTRINSSTLEKFAGLWLKNSIKNLRQFEKTDGVLKYQGLGKDIPFIITAAGPSLEKVLPYMKEIKKRAIIVCVNTALHALLASGIEPDFIVLVDPQFACARHLDFLKAPSSVLITESAVYPSVFDFECREKVMCSSLFPMGKYFEKNLGSKGALGAGGSVSTTAWDFARLAGSREIFIAGMDLGFPRKQTHIKGSQFEEKALRTGMRTDTAETKNAFSLISAGNTAAKDYKGNYILTDSKMSLFSWWFEENTKKAREEGQKTFSLTGESLKIEGIEYTEISDFLKRPCIEEKRVLFFENAEKKALSIKENYEKLFSGASFKKVKDSFLEDLSFLKKEACLGIDECQRALKEKDISPSCLEKLSTIDSKIMNSSAKEAASLIFPTQNQLEKKASSINKNTPWTPLYMSLLIYTELVSAVDEYTKLLSL